MLPSRKTLDFVVLGIGTAVLITLIWAIAYPGTMTPDSESGLVQCRYGEWFDTKPIGHILMWCLTESIWPGPFGIAALNIILLCVTLTAFVYLVTGSALAALVSASAILLYPPVLSQLPIAWRDQTGVSVNIALLSVASFMLFRPRPNETGRLRLGLGLATLIALSFLGALLQRNSAAGAFAATLGGCAALVQRNCRATLLSWLAATIFATLLLVGTTVSAMYTSAITTTTHLYTAQVAYNYYLGMLSDRTDRNLYPATVFPKLDLTRIRKLVERGPRAYGEVFWREAFIRQNIPELPRIFTADQMDALSKATRAAILQHPGTFLDIVAGQARSHFQLSSRYSGSYPLLRDVSEPLAGTTILNWSADRPEWSRALLKFLNNLQARNAWLRMPMVIVWGSLAVALLAFVLRLPYWPAMLMTTGSAWGHMLSVALLVPTPQMRLAHHSLVLGMLCLAIFVLSLVRLRGTILRKPKFASARGPYRQSEGR